MHLLTGIFRRAVSGHLVARIAIGGLALCCLRVAVARAADGAEPDRAAVRREISALFDSLANHSPRPISADHGGEPVFADNYDWNEDERVRNVANEIRGRSKRDIDAVWACVFDHIDDGRYALSYEFNGGPIISSIGQMCRREAEWSLTSGFWDAVSLPPERSEYLFHMLRMPVSTDYMRAWRRDNKGVPLYRQQIKAGEWAIKTARGLPGLSAAEKEAFASEVGKRIAKLSEKKKPTITEVRLLLFGIEFYDERKADDIRIQHDPKRACRVVQSLASRNAEPTMVPVATAVSRGTSPLFATNYDWKEEERVRRVAEKIERLSRFDSLAEPLWHCLTEHIGDNRYALSYARDGAANVLSVGSMCRSAAASMLDATYLQHLPARYWGTRTARELAIPPTAEFLKTWDHEHKGVPLCKQQIDACERAILRVQEIGGMADGDKAAFVAGVKGAMDQLRKSERPSGTLVSIIPPDARLFDGTLANEIRAPRKK